MNVQNIVELASVQLWHRHRVGINIVKLNVQAWFFVLIIGVELFVGTFVCNTTSPAEYRSRIIASRVNGNGPSGRIGVLRIRDVGQGVWVESVVAWSDFELL